MSKKTSIYLTDDVSALLRCPPRGPSEAVGIIAERYTALLEPEKRRLAALFTEGEWNAMRNACNGTAWTAAAIRGGVLADIQDSMDIEIESFGAFRDKIELKLVALTSAQQFALVEMIEEWWEKQ
jgi:hypothetical protein